MKPSPEEPRRTNEISPDTYSQEISTSSSSEELPAPLTVSIGVQTEDPVELANAQSVIMNPESEVIDSLILQNVPNSGRSGNIVNIQNPENLLLIVGMESSVDVEIDNMEIVETPRNPISSNYSVSHDDVTKMESATEDSQSPENSDNPENMENSDNSQDTTNLETPKQLPILENISSDSSQAVDAQPEILQLAAEFKGVQSPAAASPRLQALMRRSPPSEISSTSIELQETDDEESLPARLEPPPSKKAEIRAPILKLEDSGKYPLFRELHCTSHGASQQPSVVESEPGPSTSRTMIIGGSVKITSPSNNRKKITHRRDQTEFETGTNGEPTEASYDDEGICSEPEISAKQEDDEDIPSLWRRRKGRTVHGSAVGHRSRCGEAYVGGSGVESGASTPAPNVDVPSICSTSSDVSEHEQPNISTSPPPHIPPPTEDANMEMLEISPSSQRRRKLSPDDESSTDAAKKLKITEDEEDHKMEIENPSTLGSDDISELSETIIISSDSSSSMKESSPGSSIPTDEISNSPLPAPMVRRDTSDETSYSPLLAHMLRRGSSDETPDSPLPVPTRKMEDCDSTDEADKSTYL